MFEKIKSVLRKASIVKKSNSKEIEFKPVSLNDEYEVPQTVVPQDIREKVVAIINNLYGKDEISKELIQEFEDDCKGIFKSPGFVYDLVRKGEAALVKQIKERAERSIKRRITYHASNGEYQRVIELNELLLSNNNTRYVLNAKEEKEYIKKRAQELRVVEETTPKKEPEIKKVIKQKVSKAVKAIKTPKVEPVIKQSKQSYIQPEDCGSLTSNEIWSIMKLFTNGPGDKFVLC